MILGVEHIALSCREFSFGVEEIRKTGYRVLFEQIDVPNSAQKRPLLHHYESVHSIAYALGAEGPAIELISHGSFSEGSSPYELVVNGIPAGAGPTGADDGSELNWCEAFSPGGVEKYWWGAMETFIWVSQGHESMPVSVRAAIVPTSHLEGSLRFWTNGLGFRPKAGRKNVWSGLEFSCPFKHRSLEVILFDSPRANSSMLDSAGFPCISFWSSDIAEDGARLVNLGAELTVDAEPIYINGKNLRFSLLRGPGQELVELVTQERGARHGKSDH